MDELGGGRDRLERERRVAGDHRLDRRGAALERDDHHVVEIERLPEHFDRQRRRRAHAGGRNAVLGGIGLHQVDQLLDRLRRHVGMDDDGVRRRARLGDRDEVPVGIVGRLGEQARIDHVARGHEQDRIAVGRRPGGGTHAEVPGGTTLVLDDELLAELFRQLVPDQERHHVGRAAGRERHDDAHGLGRVGLREGGARQEQRGAQGREPCERDHEVPPCGRSPSHSILILASLITLDHLMVSVLMRSPNSAGVSASGTKPSVSSFSFTSGVATIFLISALSLSTMSFGVPAGATRPVSVSPSCPGMPASAAFGTSGRAPTRFVLSTASARSLPSLMLVMAGGSAVTAMGVWPPMVDVMAGAAPVNGTMVRSSPKASLNNSPLRCGVEPVAGCAKLYLPGLALTRSISSFTLLAGTLGLTVSTLGDAATSVTGVKSFTGSYGTPLA